MSLSLRMTSVLLGWSMLLAPTALAQDSNQVAVGQRIRVLAPTLGAKPRIGVMTVIGAEHIGIREQRGTQLHFNVPTAEIRRLEVRSRGPKSMILKSAARGALIGLGTSVVIAAAGSGDGSGNFGFGAVILSPVGITLGGAIGALVGRSARNNRWREVPVPRQ